MTIDVIPNYSLYVPNAFSPDNNEVNDRFRFYPSLSIDNINSFSIFDRWGSLVFEDKDIGDVNNYLGWDGTINGEKANLGVYTYVVQVLFIDGAEKIIVGDVTLLR